MIINGEYFSDGNLCLKNHGNAKVFYSKVLPYMVSTTITYVHMYSEIIYTVPVLCPNVCC